MCVLFSLIASPIMIDITSFPKHQFFFKFWSGLAKPFIPLSYLIPLVSFDFPGSPWTRLNHSNFLLKKRKIRDLPRPPNIPPYTSAFPPDAKTFYTFVGQFSNRHSTNVNGQSTQHFCFALTKKIEGLSQVNRRTPSKFVLSKTTWTDFN
jgi:hypothetical protein